MNARHRVVTVQRGHDDHGRDTYAARCEDCDVITFGGFPTRTAARDALDGHEPTDAQLDGLECIRCGDSPAVMVPAGRPGPRGQLFECAEHHEKAPAAGGNQREGEDQNTNLHEGEPIMTMIAETEDEREARYVAEHPEISATVPSWADELEVDLDDPDNVAFMGRRTVGSIEIIASGDHTPEGVALALDDAFSLWLPAHELHENTGRSLAAHARRLAVDLITAAALLDEEAAS